MHVFQPYPINEIELNPFTATGKAGVCITAEVDGTVNTMVSPFVGFGKLWEKNVAFVFIRESRYTNELLQKAELFSLTFFDENYLTALKYIKSVSGRQEDKIKNSGLHVNKHIDIPFIDEGNFAVLCAKSACFKVSDDSFIQKYIKHKYYENGDYHQVYVGEILELLAR